jgi:hypothetical protein
MALVCSLTITISPVIFRRCGLENIFAHPILALVLPSASLENSG